MKISEIPGLGRFGVFVDDVDLNTISNEEWMEIGKLHMEKLVTIIRDSNCNKDRQVELITKFGEPRYALGAYLNKKYNMSVEKLCMLAFDDSPLISEKDKIVIRSTKGFQINTASNREVQKIGLGVSENNTPNGVFYRGELDWHSNESGTLTSTPGVALLGETKMVGSATGFLTTVDYYETVSESFRSELNDMIVLHNYTPGKMTNGLNDDQQEAMVNVMFCPEDNTEVPMVIKSPGGITGLHASFNTMTGIKDMSKKDSDAIIKQIHKDLLKDEDNYVYDHWYKGDNDLCLFDNSITMHRRLGGVDGRVGYRMAYDYTNIQQDDVYQPYFQPEYQKKYNKEIRQTIDALKIDNFRLPEKQLSDYIPFMRYTQ